MACLCSMLERINTNTHMHTRYTECLSAWELHAVFKQIIKGKVRGSCGGHSFGYSSECVHYPRRKRGRWGQRSTAVLMWATGSLQPISLEHIFKSHIKNCPRSAKNALERACEYVYALVSQIRVHVHVSAFFPRRCQLAFGSTSR